jgi:phosphate transport system substrate-binding protein
MSTSGWKGMGGWRRWVTAGGTALVALVAGTMVMLVLAGGTASADSFVPVSGDGSSWSANALNQWIADVQQQGMRINYTSDGSTTGRQNFIKGQSDFAASDIPFQTNPTDGSAPEHPQAGSYAYIPITAGGTVFMYNLKINGQQVTNLRLSGLNIAKIYTGVINNWDDPALAADNPALKLPNQTIVPVVRSDGSGSSYELTEWMISQYPAVWNAYCAKAGRAPSCGATSFYPTVTGMIAQSGDLGVAGYVAQSYATGSIGYVNYSYALDAKFPVAQMLNSAGYYTEPTAQNVAVSLLQDQVDTTDVNNPALYLTQNLAGVYTDTDPRTYPLSSYGYLIIPTTVFGSFNTEKGHTLGAFAYYSLCQGQVEAAPLGYSPMPINLVQAGFDQIAKIPGVTVQAFNYTTCKNPTFSTSGANQLAATAPQPPACDKQGPTQCTTGTGGAAAVATPVTPGSAAATSTASKAASTAGASSGSGGSGATGAAAAATGAGGATGPTTATGDASTTVPCDPSTGSCSSAEGLSGAAPAAATATLPVNTGWSSNQSLLVLIGLALVGLVLLPGVLVRRMDRPKK